MSKTEKICGTCKYHKPESFGDFSCDNSDGEYFGDYTGYNDRCPDWEKREGKYDERNKGL